MGGTVQRVHATDAPEAITKALLDDGAVIVEDVLSADVVARFNAELDEHLQGGPPDPSQFINPAIAWFFGARTRHVTGVAAKSRVFVDEVLLNPVFKTVCDEVLLPNCSRYQLNLAHVLDRGPGAEQQLLHRDEAVWVHMPEPHPEIQLASMIALVAFTAENGATRLVPGSHRWDRSVQATDGDLVVADMAAGSAVIYLGSTIHAGGGNTTADEWRRGMHLSFCLGWLRCEENQYLATPLEVARTLPREAQELLGFAAHDGIMAGGGYLGALDLQDPVVLMERGDL